MDVDSLDPNLLASTRKPKSDAPLEEPLNPRTKKTLKLAAYSLVFLVSLFFFVLVKIPNSLVANLTLNALNQQTPFQWQAERVGLGFFLTPHLWFEKLSLDPKMPGAGIPLAFEEMSVYPNPFSFLPIGGPPAFSGSFRAEAYQTRFTGYVSTANPSALRLETAEVDLAKLAPLLQQAGIDVKGVLTKLLVQLTLQNQRLSTSDGELVLQGKNIVFDPSPLQLPMPLPILNLGDIDIRGTVTRGQLKIETFRVGSASKDLEVQLSGTFTFADVLPLSRLDLRLRVKPSTTLEKAVPSLPSMLDAFAAKKADGFYSLRLSGILSSLGPPQKE